MVPPRQARPGTAPAPGLKPKAKPKHSSTPAFPPALSDSTNTTTDTVPMPNSSSTQPKPQQPAAMGVIEGKKPLNAGKKNTKRKPLSEMLGRIPRLIRGRGKRAAPQLESSVMPMPDGLSAEIVDADNEDAGGGVTEGEETEDEAWRIDERDEENIRRRRADAQQPDDDQRAASPEGITRQSLDMAEHWMREYAREMFGGRAQNTATATFSSASAEGQRSIPPRTSVSIPLPTTSTSRDPSNEEEQPDYIREMTLDLPFSPKTAQRIVKEAMGLDSLPSARPAFRINDEKTPTAAHATRDQSAEQEHTEEDPLDLFIDSVYHRFAADRRELEKMGIHLPPPNSRETIKRVLLTKFAKKIREKGLPDTGERREEGQDVPQTQLPRREAESMSRGQKKRSHAGGAKASFPSPSPAMAQTTQRMAAPNTSPPLNPPPPSPAPRQTTHTDENETTIKYTINARTRTPSERQRLLAPIADMIRLYEEDACMEAQRKGDGDMPPRRSREEIWEDVLVLIGEGSSAAQAPAAGGGGMKTGVDIPASDSIIDPNPGYGRAGDTLMAGRSAGTSKGNKYDSRLNSTRCRPFQPPSTHPFTLTSSSALITSPQPPSSAPSASLPDLDHIFRTFQASTTIGITGLHADPLPPPHRVLQGEEYERYVNPALPPPPPSPRGGGEKRKRDCGD